RLCRTPLHLLSLRLARPLTPLLFPYTTLFRSRPSPLRSSPAGLRSCSSRVVLSWARSSVPRYFVAPVARIPESARRDEIAWNRTDRKSTRLNSSHDQNSYAVFCLKKKKNN